MTHYSTGGIGGQANPTTLKRIATLSPATGERGFRPKNGMILRLTPQTAIPLLSWGLDAQNIAFSADL